METYRIIDEPRSGSLDRFVNDPVWPLFGMMLGGAWLGLPWFVFNGFALGSATLRREVALAVAALVGAAVLTMVAFALRNGGVLPVEAIPYIVVFLTVWKLGIGYSILQAQRRSFALWEHYGGQPRRAFAVLFIAVLIRTNVLPKLSDFWWLVLA